MVNKSTLRLIKAEDPEILAIASNRYSFIDDIFYTNQMHEVDEETESRTFSSKIMCVRADWIINDQSDQLDGQIFLKELLNKGSKDQFRTNYVQIIVKFLFKQFRDSILSRLLPFYIVHFLINLYMIIYQSTVDSDFKTSSGKITGKLHQSNHNTASESQN